MVGSSVAAKLVACFAAGTPLLTPEGSKPIERFAVGDLVLSRPEDDVNAPVQARRVEEVFVNLGEILHLHVGDEVIRTTPEHPFFVLDKGWTPAINLEIGDLLSSHDGQWVPVTDLLNTGEFETTYNLRVAEYSTYFVGGDGWWFSVWAHNVYGDIADHRPYFRDATGRWHDARGRFAASPVISRQKQNSHVLGTRDYENRVKTGKPTSAFSDRVTADPLVIEAWANGTTVLGRPNIRDYDFGRDIGVAPRGGHQRRVRVHQDEAGRIHGHPSGPVF